MPWSDDDSMLHQANGLMYGLAAAFVTNNPKMAMHAAEDIEAEYVWINTQGRYLGAPYGGWKQSGIGQGEGLDELLSYMQVKNLNLRW